jgi:hypothetical protein
MRPQRPHRSPSRSAQAGVVCGMRAAWGAGPKARLLTFDDGERISPVVDTSLAYTARSSGL